MDRLALIPTSADFNLARDFVAELATQLRGPDALHLAIARNHGIEEILTLDDGLPSPPGSSSSKRGAAFEGIRGVSRPLLRTAEYALDVTSLVI